MTPLISRSTCTTTEKHFAFGDPVVGFGNVVELVNFVPGTMGMD
jgi:hypothetical protein